jgi:hypothetical protein
LIITFGKKSDEYSLTYLEIVFVVCGKGNIKFSLPAEQGGQTVVPVTFE